MHGVTPPGTRVAVAGLAPVRSASGAFAAYVPASAEAAHIELQAAGAPTLATELPLAPARGLRAVAALADLELSFGGDAGVLVTARGAGAASGTAGPIAYAAGVDVDDRERSLADLARPRDALAVEHALDPERSFLATGDDAAAGDLNPGRGRIWARVEAPGARLDLGTARTGLTGAELGRYDRAFFGAKAAGEHTLGPARLEASAFGATLRADSGRQRAAARRPRRPRGDGRRVLLALARRGRARERGAADRVARSAHGARDGRARARAGRGLRDRLGERQDRPRAAARRRSRARRCSRPASRSRRSGRCSSSTTSTPRRGRTRRTCRAAASPPRWVPWRSRRTARTRSGATGTGSAPRPRRSTSARRSCVTGRGGAEPRDAVRRGRGERVRAEPRRRDHLRAARGERR